MLNDEVRVPAQLFEMLRQPDVLVVHIGHVPVLFGIATNAVPKGKLQLPHSRASDIVDPWASRKCACYCATARPGVHPPAQLSAGSLLSRQGCPGLPELRACKNGFHPAG